MKFWDNKKYGYFIYYNLIFILPITVAAQFKA
jgi:hypothetical protein